MFNLRNIEDSGVFLKKSIYLACRDELSWSISEDAKSLHSFCSNLSIPVNKTALFSPFIHFICWYQVNFRRYRWIKGRRKIIATASSEVAVENPQFQSMQSFVSLWIAPNKKQYNFFNKMGAKVAYQPFYVNENIFYPMQKTREELCQDLKIDHTLFKGKHLIGSFQRDSQGENLMEPKPQKDPQLFLDLIKNLSIDRDKIMVILAGPRRHYLLKKMQQENIPYFYYGEEPKGLEDDVHINNQNLETMSLLYNLLDAYVVSSRSEGGPKAILEAALCKTPIISTDVGLARDFLEEDAIYSSEKEGVDSLQNLLNNRYFRKDLTENHYKNVYSVCNYEAMQERWKNIYQEVGLL